MYRSRLVPRFIAVLGLIGGPLVFVSATAVLFGVYEDLSTIGVVAAAPIFAWEVSLALWMIIKGFRPSPVLTGVTQDVAGTWPLRLPDHRSGWPRMRLRILVAA